MESLTIEDIDLYSQASRRAMKEDLYTIVDTCFMPSGIECDQYSVIGEIEEICLKKNRITDEEIYDMKLECNDLHFRVCINKRIFWENRRWDAALREKSGCRGIADFKG